MLAATPGGQGDTQRWVMLPISLKRKLRRGRGGWALLRPLPHLPGAGGWPAACGWSWAPRGAPAARWGALGSGAVCSCDQYVPSCVHAVCSDPRPLALY